MYNNDLCVISKYPIEVDLDEGLIHIQETVHLQKGETLLELRAIRTDKYALHFEDFEPVHYQFIVDKDEFFSSGSTIPLHANQVKYVQNFYDYFPSSHLELSSQEYQFYLFDKASTLVTYSW